MIDSFDPHEPWDPPRHYIDLYADPDFDGTGVPHTHAGKMARIRKLHGWKGEVDVRRARLPVSSRRRRRAKPASDGRVRTGPRGRCADETRAMIVASTILVPSIVLRLVE